MITRRSHLLCVLLLMVLVFQNTHGSPLLEPISVKEVMITDGALGEVWLCGGQSNMGLPVSYASDGGAHLFSDPFDVRYYSGGKWERERLLVGTTCGPRKSVAPLPSRAPT